MDGDEARAQSTSFTLDGSNDNSTWTALVTKTSYSFSGGSSSYDVFDFANSTAYRYIRYNQTASSHGTGLATTYEVEMMVYGIEYNVITEYVSTFPAFAQLKSLSGISAMSIPQVTDTIETGGHSITAVGDATQVTSDALPNTWTISGTSNTASHYKFGSRSLYTDGSNSDYVKTTDWNTDITGQDWAVEFWYKDTESATSNHHVWALAQTSALETNCIQGWFYNGEYKFKLRKAGSTVVEFAGSGSSFSTTAFRHFVIAYTHSSTTYEMFSNGTRIGTATDATAPPDFSSGYTLRLVGPNDMNGGGLNGKLDEFRFSVGTNRGYTGSTLTEPSSAFTVDANTKALLHFDSHATDVTDEAGSTVSPTVSYTHLTLPTKA